MKVKILMIALNKAFLSHFEHTSDTYELYVLEERDLYEAHPSAYTSSAIKELRFGEYQQSERFMETALQWHQQIGFDAVVPGMEYAVKAAYSLAASIGLINPGAKAVQAFTNKYELRQHCVSIGVPQPRFASVSTQQDVKAFFNGTPIVLKPANRRASVGVVRIDSFEDIADAWMESTSADEGDKLARRELTWQYLVEDFAEGPEVSVESLVAKGKPLFHNVTRKETVGGRYFTEVGHTVPATLAQHDRDTLIAAKEQLLEGLDVQTGLFHSEWKVGADGPVLIECAARAAGDMILDLIQAAYGFNMYEAFLAILTARIPDVQQESHCVAAIRYFQPKSGCLVRIDGLDILTTDLRVLRYNILAVPGQMIGSFKNSWSRVGSFTVCGHTVAELEELVHRIEGTVQFVVEELAR